MSRENVEIAERAVSAYLGNDPSAMLDSVASHIVSRPVPDSPDASERQGYEGLLGMLGEWSEVWQDFSFDVTRVWDDGDLVFIAGDQSGRGTASGAPWAHELVLVFTVSEREITRLLMFNTWSEALAAMGLDE